MNSKLDISREAASSVCGPGRCVASPRRVFGIWTPFAGIAGGLRPRREEVSGTKAKTLVPAALSFRQVDAFDIALDGTYLDGLGRA